MSHQFVYSFTIDAVNIKCSCGWEAKVHRNQYSLLTMASVHKMHQETAKMLSSYEIYDKKYVSMILSRKYFTKDVIMNRLRLLEETYFNDEDMDDASLIRANKKYEDLITALNIKSGNIPPPQN